MRPSVSKKKTALTLREKAEKALRRRNTLGAEAASLDMHRLLHELQTHQIELEIQNEELRDAQVELEASRDRYISLYDFAPVGYFTLDARGHVVEANLTLTNALGVERQQLLNKPFYRFVFFDDRPRFVDHYRRVLAKESPLTCEVRLLGPRQVPFYAYLESNLTVTRKGPRHCRTSVTNITALKLLEDALRASHAELERKVSERTSELLKTNEKLEAEIAGHRKTEKELLASRGHLRSLSDHLLTIRENERAAIARDIHDELGQMLTAVAIDLALLKKNLSGDTPLAEGIRSIMVSIGASIDTVQRITSELRPRLLDHLGLIPALEWHAKEFSKRTAIKCELAVSRNRPPTLRSELSTALFRIFQEALTNVSRHAKATKVVVALKTARDRAVFKICDNGKGITGKEVSGPHSFGIMGMQERARLMGGTVTFRGVPKKGTTVTVTVPLQKRALS